MRTVGIDELRDNLERILRDVGASGEPCVVTVDGEALAEIAPIPNFAPAEAHDQDFEERLRRLDEVAREVSALWPRGLSVVDAIAEQRS